MYSTANDFLNIVLQSRDDVGLVSTPQDTDTCSEWAHLR